MSKKDIYPITCLCLYIIWLIFDFIFLKDPIKTIITMIVPFVLGFIVMWVVKQEVKKGRKK